MSDGMWLLWLLAAVLFCSVCFAVVSLVRGGRPNEITLAKTPDYQAITSIPLRRMWEDRLAKVKLRVKRHVNEANQLMSLNVHMASPKHITQCERKLAVIMKFADTLVEHCKNESEIITKYGDIEYPDYKTVMQLHTSQYIIENYRKPIDDLSLCIVHLQIYLSEYSDSSKTTIA